MTTVAGGTLVLEDRLLPEGAVVIVGARQVWVGPVAELPASWRDLPRRHAAFIAPGLIDEHLHGSFGIEVLTAGPEALLDLAGRLAATGTTSFLATTVSAGEEALHLAARNVAAAQARQTGRGPAGAGAELLGLHLEGPALNPEKAGAHAPDRLRPVSPPELAALQHLSHGAVRLMTLAPELVTADLLSALLALGIRLSAGHSQATFAQAQAAFAAGVTHVTHLFNAMPPLGHREPGLAGAALTDPNVFAELILDFVHVHPAAAELAIRAKGTEGIVLITDALAVAGLPPGRQTWDGRTVEVTKEAVFLPDGTLAGSTLSLHQAVRNAVKLGFALPAAVAMASYHPARGLGLSDRKGRLAAGLDADLLLLTADLTLAGVYCRGQAVPLVHA